MDQNKKFRIDEIAVGDDQTECRRYDSSSDGLAFIPRDFFVQQSASQGKCMLLKRFALWCRQSNLDSLLESESWSFM